MKAKAMVQVADRRLEMQEFEVPKIKADEGLLRLEACGLCGSDIEQYDGLLAQKGIVQYPMVPGHEPVGIIEEIGAEASKIWDLKKGDRVAIAGPLNCGRCTHCLGGSHHLCRSLFPHEKFIPGYGFMPTHMGSGLWGGYGEYLHLHPKTLFCKIPDNVPPQVSTIYQALASGLRWAVSVPQTRVGDDVLVLGCGQRGLASVVALQRAGAGRIIVTGLQRDAFKLDLARHLGATHTLFADKEDVVARVMEITNGVGVDVAIDLVPVAGGPVRDAIDAVKTGGVIVLAGIKGGATEVPIDTDKLVTREITVKGVMTQSYRFYQESVELLSQDIARLSSLHTHEFPLEQVEEALHVLNGERPDQKAISISIRP